MKMKNLHLIFAFVLISLGGMSQTYVKDYTYNASENESKLDARKIALKETKKLLIEELGVYVNTTTTYNNINSNISVETQTKIISECVTQTEIIEEKWDGDYYYIKVKMYVDKKDLIKRLNKISKKYENYEAKTIKKSEPKYESNFSGIDKIDWTNEYYFISVYNSYDINNNYKVGFSAGIISDNILSVGLFWETNAQQYYNTFGLSFEPLFFNKRRVNLSIPVKLAGGKVRDGGEKFLVIEPGVDVGVTFNITEIQAIKISTGISYKLMTTEEVQNSFCVNLSIKLIRFGSKEEKKGKVY